MKKILRYIGQLVPNPLYWRISPLVDKTSFGRVTKKTARHYYDIWVQHLFLSRQNGFTREINSLAEIGPGDTIGVGICALLCGASRYYSYDIINHTNVAKNLKMLDELTKLIKDELAFEASSKKKQSNSEQIFLSKLFSNMQLERSLSSERLKAIREVIKTGLPVDDIQIIFVVNSRSPSQIQEKSFDFIISNVAMEHVDDLVSAYRMFSKILAIGGCMSHNIDFHCHGTANRWNGHWSYTKKEWEKIKRKHPYLINREPYSKHKKLILDNNFSIITDLKQMDFSGISREALAVEFKDIIEDLNIRSALIQAIRV